MTFNNNIEQYKFPYEIKHVDPETNEELLKNYTGEKTGFVQVGPNKWTFPSPYEKMANQFYNFQARPDDIWVVTFPRSGTTWTQELVWMIANDLNYDAAQKETLTKRFPFLEFSIFIHDETKKEFLRDNSDDIEKQKFIESMAQPGYEYLSEMKSPRFIKTHFPISLLPPSVMNSGCKVIYVARNPLDVSVSFYHQNRLLLTQGLISDFTTDFNFFKRGLKPYCPYWTHINEGWDIRNSKNVLFMFYEDMNKNLKETIQKVCNFLDKPIKDEQEIEKLVNHLNIKNFRNNTSVNCCELKEVGIMRSGEEDFVRRGKTGGWINEFTPELKKEANEWIQQNLKQTNLKFP